MKWRRGRAPSPAVIEAREARVEAEKQLERVRADTPKYRALGESLKELREKNHFALAIEATFRGER